MERGFIKEQQCDGIVRATGAGVYMGDTRRIVRGEIKEMHFASEGPPAIAKAFSCSRMQVYRILKNRAW